MPRKSEGRLPPKDDECAVLGGMFRIERERAGLTLSSLEKATGICVMTLRRHEAGNLMMRTDDLTRSARALNVDPALLFPPNNGDGQNGNAPAAKR